MKSYPSISHIIRYDIPVFVQNKLDGSNIRAEWNYKKGFYKFGSRTQLIDESSPILGESISLIKNKYQESLSKIFVDKKWQSVICFFEFFGSSSFAGQHAADEPHDLILFDVNPYKQGILSPHLFYKYFGALDVPTLLYEGYLTPSIVEDIRNSTMASISFEGVVCKCENTYNKNGYLMFKIKTKVWLNKLKIFCKDDLSLFEKLQ